MTDLLNDLYRTAANSDSEPDWMSFYQALSGTALIVPLHDTVGDTAKPVTVQADGITCVVAYPGIEVYASTIERPGDYAEIAGVQLAGMLSKEACSLVIRTASPITLGPEKLTWIADTFGAEVTRATGAGVSVRTPDLPALEVMELLGRTIGALGADCPEAWLVAMSTEDEDDELVLVMGLADNVRRMEVQVAETVTRAIQSVTSQPFAVACPDRGAPLMATARKVGIGVGG